jgi:hypothetical protein
MLEERSLRRVNFGCGTPVRFADRQAWNLLTPVELKSRGLNPSQSAEYQQLTRGIIEAESRDEMLRAELALAIFLLGQNYELTPPACFQILGFEPDSSALVETQEAIHRLAMDHVHARQSLNSPRPAARPGRVGRLSFLRRLRTSIPA